MILRITSQFFVGLLIATLLVPDLGAQEARESLMGRKVEDFSLVEPLNEKNWRLSKHSQDADAVIFYFLSTECPVTNRYLPALNKLKDADYSGKKVVVVGINSNVHDSKEEIKQHAADFEVNFPILSDAQGTLARRFGATRTAEAIVLDSKLKVRYRGAIDDRYERGVTKPKATKMYLNDAIRSIFSGRQVKTSMTSVEACPLNLAEPEQIDSAQEVVTYSEHVAPIIQLRCQSCHRPDGIGPFVLMDFDDAEAWSDSIREVITNGLMPPWHADAPHGHFSNDRSLTDDEYKTLLDWIDGGSVEGDKSKLPPPREFPATWTIGTPDLVVEMEKEVAVPAESPELGIPYKYIWAGEPFEKETWVTAAEVHPGSPSVVHHASVYIVEKGVEIKLVDDERPGGLAELASPINSLPHLISFVPGDQAFVFPEELGIRIPKGARLIFEMHYTATGKKENDRTEVALVFADEKPEHEVLSSGVINFMFSIPAGADAHPVKARTRKFRHDMMLLSLNPHMHYRGKSFRYELVEPNGNRSVLLDVPKYSFDWQSTYRLADPIKIPKGAYIEGIASFDNSEDNPFNPDPTQVVEWGEQSWEEMMIGSFEYYYRKK